MKHDYFYDKRENVDSLTKLYNREVIFGYIDILITKKIPFVMGIMDVDNFKYINDGYGHKTGDRALMEIAKRIDQIVGEKGVVGRYGGDEFLFVIPEITEYDDVWQNSHDLLECTKNLASKDLNELSMTVSLGSSRFPLDSTNIDGLFELADKALYRAKMKGRNCFVIYLKEKHANINLKTERDKIVSSTYIESMIFNKICQENLKVGIIDVINYVGSFFMIDHLCVCDENNLYFDYYHPICKNRDFKILPSKIMKSSMNSQTGIFFKNYIGDNLNQNIMKELEEQNIYSILWVEIKSHGKSFGYLRADICSNPSGRIWQNLDIDILHNIACLIGVELYYNNKEIKDL